MTESSLLVHQLPYDQLVWMLRKMCETRYFEEKAEERYTRGLVHGTMHLSIGVVVRPMMNLTLSADHRVVDGAAAARFLSELKGLIENPYLLV